MGAAKYSVSFDRRVLASLLSPRIALINNLSSSKRGIALITLKKQVIKSNFSQAESITLQAFYNMTSHGERGHLLFHSLDFIENFL